MDLDALVSTRATLHRLAEHLLAGDLARRTGKIGLRPSPGGFGQPEVLDAGVRHRLRIDGTDLVVLAGDVETRHPIEGTAASLATWAGVDLGPPADAYQPETVLDPEAPLVVDAEAADALAGWFDLVAEALEEVRRRDAAAEPTIVQLWPEHFDVACTLREVNLGGSPGDGDHAEPYLYVGPWSPRSGAFWNEPWGASWSWRDVPDVATAVELLESGLAEAGDVG